MRVFVLLVLVFLMFQSTAFSEWFVETVDNGAIYNPSLALNSEGYPCIVYPSEGIGVKYAEWDGSQWLLDCAFSTTYTNVSWVSLALDSADAPHICFPFGPLFYVTRDDLLAWQIEQIPYISSASHVSLTLDDIGQPRVAYNHNYGAEIGYAALSDSTWDVEYLDTGNNTGWYLSMLIDPDNLPHISYARKSPHLLMYACMNGIGEWSFQTVDSLSEECWSTSLAMDGEGRPHIAFNAEGELRYAYWTGSQWHIETLDACDSGSWQYGTSIALDSADYPHIAYCTADGTYLMHTSWNGSDWQHEQVDSLPGYWSGDPDLVLDALDRPHIAFHLSHSGSALRYAWNDGTGIGEGHPEAVGNFTCGSLYPNPTPGMTSLEFSLTAGSHVDVMIYGIGGRMLERCGSGQYTAGTHTVSFVVSSPGMYLARISSEGQVEVRRFVVID